MKTNLVLNPSFAGSGTYPDAWSVESPRPGLAPKFSVARSGRASALVQTATGDPYIFGCWKTSVQLEKGNWYRGSIRARVRNLAQPHLSLLAHVAGHVLVPVETRKNEIRFQVEFRAGTPYDTDDMELYLRATKSGWVEWFDPRVEEIAEPKHRVARVATTRFGELPAPISLDAQRRRIAALLDEAGAVRPDIAVLTEFCPAVGVDHKNYDNPLTVCEPVPGGPVCKVLAAAARKYRMHVLAGVMERRGKYCFNTAVLIDRKGKLAGTYEKTHLTFGELKSGYSCGRRYPVFDLDFGRIGVHICYDEWFPEVARYYAHAGVEILFLPVWGGKPITWRTRALDNGIYFVSASVTPPSMIISSSGAILAETHHAGVVWADLNLDVRPTNWYVDPTLLTGMPCIRPHMRNVLDDRLLDDRPAAMKK